MNKAEVILDCHHAIRLTINSSACKEGEQAYCRYDGWQIVREVRRTEYRVVCCDCPYGRWVGQSEAEARRTKDKHIRGNRRHDAFYMLDAITPSGGTSRKILLRNYLTQGTGAYTVVSSEPEKPAPF